MTTIVRAGGPFSPAVDFGLLAKLPGRWVGKGFNLIARPNRQGDPTNPVFFLELNATQETLEFFPIGGDIPNRGDSEKDAELHAMNYLQVVTDCVQMTMIHKEPGFWLHVPTTAEGGESYVRQAVIPHGDSLLAQSTFFTTVKGGPILNPVNTLPFPQADPIPALNADPAHPKGGPYIDPYVKGVLPDDCMPKGLDAAKTIKDPTEVLRAAIVGQTIASTDVIQISTVPPGGIVNIPFVVKNANAVQMDAIFWIETVAKDPDVNLDNEDDDPKSMFFQLQYVQRVILDFDNVHWPHVSVATLIKE
ncbi:MAG TPA: heme-binding protein [Vicinamibacterales bacterium]|jgi:hypothetical protein|nr:heme-binding protein [Vicinamibacterales bacterium]